MGLAPVFMMADVPSSVTITPDSLNALAEMLAQANTYLNELTQKDPAQLTAEFDDAAIVAAIGENKLSIEAAATAIGDKLTLVNNAIAALQNEASQILLTNKDILTVLGGLPAILSQIPGNIRAAFQGTIDQLFTTLDGFGALLQNISVSVDELEPITKEIRDALNGLRQDLTVVYGVGRGWSQPVDLSQSGKRITLPGGALVGEVNHDLVYGPGKYSEYINANPALRLDSMRVKEIGLNPDGSVNYEDIHTRSCSSQYEYDKLDITNKVWHLPKIVIEAPKQDCALALGFRYPGVVGTVLIEDITDEEYFGTAPAAETVDPGSDPASDPGSGDPGEGLENL